jgi:hypothetical protein
MRWESIHMFWLEKVLQEIQLYQWFNQKDRDKTQCCALFTYPRQTLPKKGIPYSKRELEHSFVKIWIDNRIQTLQSLMLLVRTRR